MATIHHPGLTPDDTELQMSFEQIKDGIRAAIEYKSAVVATRIAKFLPNDEQLFSALRQVELKTPIVYDILDDEKGVVTQHELDQEAIRNKLLTHKTVVSEFLKSHSDWVLTVSNTFILPNASSSKYKAMAKCFTEVEPQNGGPFPFYKIQDYSKLDSLINTLEEKEAISLSAPDGIGMSTWEAIYELAEACGISSEGDIKFFLGNKGSSSEGYNRPWLQSHSVVGHILTISLYNCFVSVAKSSKRLRFTPGNINEAEDVSFISRPPIEAVLDSLFMIADQGGEVAKTLDQVYYNDIAQQAANGGKGGLPITISQPNQTTIWDLIKAPVLERGDANNILKLITTLTLPAFFMLHEAVEQSETDTVSTMTITELMRLNPRFDTPKVRQKGIKRSDKVAFVNSLILLQNINYPYKTQCKDKNGKIYYEYNSVKVFDYSLVENSRGEIDTIKNLHFTQEYIDKINTNIGLIYGKGFYSLTQDTYQKLDLKIGLLFVQSRQALDDTTHNKPTEISVVDLAKGVFLSYSTNPTVYNGQIEKALDYLVEVGEIGSWHTGQGKGHHKISQSIPESLHLFIYPSENHLRGYITTRQRSAIKKAEKQEQADRRKRLKRLLKGYKSKADLALQLGVTKTVLEALINGTELLCGEIWEKVQELAAEYE